MHATTYYENLVFKNFENVFFDSYDSTVHTTFKFKPKTIVLYCDKMKR